MNYVQLNPEYDGQCCPSTWTATRTASCGQRVGSFPDLSVSTGEAYGYGCAWNKLPEQESGFIVVPAGVRKMRIIARGQHGGYMNGTPLDDKRAGIAGWGAEVAGYIDVTPGQGITVLPQSQYAGVGGGLPSNPNNNEGVRWTRGGASSAVYAPSAFINAAGGGGQGVTGNKGTHADSGGPYLSRSMGEAPERNGLASGGGGGAGCYGGRAGFPYVGAPAAGGYGGKSCFPPSFTVDWNRDPLDQIAAVEIHWACIPPLPPTVTTITEDAGATTTYETSTLIVSTETLTAATITETAYETVESALPVSYTDSTYTPDPIPTTLTDTETTYPPSSTAFETSTPETSFFTETESIETTPATQTVYETVTPATSFFTETRTETISPATRFETVTVTPATRTLAASATTTQTVASGTTTTSVTSATGHANCVQQRMTYPAACCPTAYMSGLKNSTAPSKLRRRNVIYARDYTTVTVSTGTKTATQTVDGTATTEVTPPVETTTVTETTTGPLTISTNIITANASTETFYETQTVEGDASTVTVTLTADAPSYTYTSTEYREAPTPLYTNTSTADAPSLAATDVEYETLATPVQTVETEAATPITTSTSTSTVLSTVPAATATSTQYVQSTTCAVENKPASTCPLPLLGLADQLSRRFFSGQPVVIDCGSAGTFYYS
ncbi:hypothetical protein JCM6882_007089 [Rhodosporidiobolus microsporus]